MMKYTQLNFYEFFGGEFGTEAVVGSPFTGYYDQTHKQKALIHHIPAGI